MKKLYLLSAILTLVCGLPAAAETAGLDEAFQQLETYKDQIPSLFRTNAVLVTSDGIQARIGSLTADRLKISHGPHGSS